MISTHDATGQGYAHKSGKSKKPETFRDDNLYRFTLPQQAALAFAFCSALDRTGKADDKKGEDVTQKNAFVQRYGTILDQCFSTKSDKDAQGTEKDAQSTIVPLLRNLRDYFSHYLHTPDKITELKTDTAFQKFITILHTKAIGIWQGHHSAWNERYSLPKEKESEAGDLATAIDNFNWDIFKKSIKDGGFKELEGENCPLPFCDILLFLSVFISKGNMTRLLDNMPGLKLPKEDEETPDPERRLTIRAKREVLSALCFTESHDVHYFADRPDSDRPDDPAITTALTILDHFAKRMGERKDRKGKLLHKKPEPLTPEDVEQKKTPEICRSQSDTFFIKMLVSTIEACGFLPGVCIARARDGQPVFDSCLPDTKKRREYIETRKERKKEYQYTAPTPKKIEDWYDQGELHIRGSNVAIMINGENDSPLHGSLSMNALKMIVLKGMELRKHQEKPNYGKEIVQPIEEYIKKISMVKNNPPESLYYKNVNWIERSLPDFSSKKISDSVESINTGIIKRIKYINQCRECIKNDHQKAGFILWWINRRLSQHNSCLNKTTYQNALWALTGEFNCEYFLSLLPKLSAKTLQWKGKIKTMDADLGNSTLEGIFKKVKSDYTWYTETYFPKHINDEKELREIAKVLGVRSVKNTPRDHNAEKARDAFFNRFSRQLGPSPRYLFMKYFPDLKMNADSRRTHPEHDRLPVFSVIQKLQTSQNSSGAPLRPDKKLYCYQNKEGTRRLSEKARICLEHDCLLLFLAEQLIKDKQEYQIECKPDFSYTAKIKVKDTKFTLVIDSAQARRSYVSIHPDRIKNVVNNYWVPFPPDQMEIPFCLGPETPKHEEPLSWLEAEGRMERERLILIQAVFTLEKELAERAADSGGLDKNDFVGIINLINQLPSDSKKEDSYIEIKPLLTHFRSYSEEAREDMACFRNWALHQSPKKPFNQAPDELGKLFSEIQKKLEEKSERQRKAGTRENSKIAQKMKKMDQNLTKKD